MLGGKGYSAPETRPTARVPSAFSLRTLPPCPARAALAGTRQVLLQSAALDGVQAARSRCTPCPMGHVLEGIRVLDFGRYIAGPYCAALLADLGADVIRIERIGGGEDRWVGPITDDGVGAIYITMNRNKRAMTLDPVVPEGREIVKKLVATADVVVANLPPEVLRRLALDLESLRRVKPDIISRRSRRSVQAGRGATSMASTVSAR